MLALRRSFVLGCRFNAMLNVMPRFSRGMPRTFSTASTSLVELLKGATNQEKLEDVSGDAADFTFAVGSEPGAFSFTRELNGEKIVVSGNALDMEENGSEEDVQEDDAEDTAEIGVPCTLEFIKGDKTINISATAWSKSGWSLRQIGTTAAGYQVEAAHVDETMLNNFYDYLAERGVEDELATIVTSTAQIGRAHV